MELKYSKTPFEGYTHRFIVRFRIDKDWMHDALHETNITIYSNSGDYQDLDKFITNKKSDMVKDFYIVHRASKEQDDLDSKFIDEMLNSY